MPFQHAAGYSFSAVSVRKNAPALSGVYGISNDHEWIFVGASDDIQAALMLHLRETGTLLQARTPMGFVFELCGPSDRITRQNRLVLEMEPVCNRQRSSGRG
jgi:hypothetical protein